MRRLTVLLLFLVACSGSTSGGGGDRADGYDTTEVEQELEGAQRQATPDLVVSDAKCPDRVDVVEDLAFECTVVVAGAVAPYTVRLTDVDAAKQTAHYEIRPAKAVIAVSKLVDFIRSQLNPGSEGSRIDCGPAKVMVLDPGGTIECSVTDRQTTQVATFRVDDLQGKVTIVAVR